MGHLQENGFEVEINEVTDTELHATKQRLGVPGELEGCHTAVVNGYVVEGHVPADLVYRMLAEAPEARGLAVPGMPPGSPGMESSNPQPYNVILFTEDGGRTVYAQR
ncbi:MAG: DUF411 domain-containing protein [Gemmatimonadota bacterium]|nr:DUF411 domain-containing protein [Gemmatimonadota bacterium]MDH5804123.1 DUF411 domain-containing protein [Gemmatimonadota bacterium]